MDLFDDEWVKPPVWHKNKYSVTFDDIFETPFFEQWKIPDTEIKEEPITVTEKNKKEFVKKMADRPELDDFGYNSLEADGIDLDLPDDDGLSVMSEASNTPSEIYAGYMERTGGLPQAPPESDDDGLGKPIKPDAFEKREELQRMLDEYRDISSAQQQTDIQSLMDEMKKIGQSLTTKEEVKEEAKGEEAKGEASEPSEKTEMSSFEKRNGDLYAQTSIVRDHSLSQLIKMSQDLGLLVPSTAQRSKAGLVREIYPKLLKLKQLALTPKKPSPKKRPPSPVAEDEDDDETEEEDVEDDETEKEESSESESDEDTFPEELLNKAGRVISRGDVRGLSKSILKKLIREHPTKTPKMKGQKTTWLSRKVIDMYNI